MPLHACLCVQMIMYIVYSSQEGLCVELMCQILYQQHHELITARVHPAALTKQAKLTVSQRARLMNHVIYNNVILY